MKLVALVHVISYPVLVWLVWTWLGIAESSGAALAGSLVLAIVIIAAISWLLATAFDGDLRVRATWARSLLYVVIALCLLGVTLWLRKISFWVAFALLIAALLPPLLLRRLSVVWNWRYWLACIVLVVAGGYIPWKLATWVPGAKTLTTQAASMGVRFAIAYLISVAALLAFAYFLRRLAVPREPTPAAQHAHGDSQGLSPA
jgi:hypothetical protein